MHCVGQALVLNKSRGGQKVRGRAYVTPIPFLHNHVAATAMDIDESPPIPQFSVSREKVRTCCNSGIPLANFQSRQRLF
jgi:hypothetical protein